MKLIKRLRLSELGDDSTVDLIELIRAPFMPMLSVDTGSPIIFSPFVNPFASGPDDVMQENRTLGSRMRCVSDYSIPIVTPGESSDCGACSESDSEDESGPQILLWEPKRDTDSASAEPIYADPMLSRVLRPHQVEGVKFVFECLMGLRGPAGSEGCILADDMGLGKTLQSIGVVWTLLNNNINDLPGPAVRQALVLCPASLVNNWASEFDMWTKKKCPIVAVAEKCRDKVIGQFTNFRYSKDARVLISSYESFRLHAKLVRECNIDLIVCDEAHRLKNDKTKMSACISKLKAKKRLLLTGTPIQNNMSEFFAMIALAIPSLVTDDFNRKFSLPIARGRDPAASPRDKQLGDTALASLSELSSSFILRRTNALLAKLLPKKHLVNVFCKLDPIQRDLYVKVTDWLLESASKGTGALRATMLLMKICCHPRLLPEEAFGSSEPLAGHSLPAHVGWIGKLRVVESLLKNFQHVGDKCVVISTYTSALDVVAQLCKELGLGVVCLDGSVGISKRHDIVTKFNKSSGPGCPSVFLLSSKAGGCGINLIGANRLIMLDADWNPANDKQAMARVWREGQKKVCWIYRLFSAGTIEEKVLQRQINKDGLSSSVISAGDSMLKEGLSRTEIRSLFGLKPEHVLSDTHHVIQCKGCHPFLSRPSDQYVEDDLLSWDHLTQETLSSAKLLLDEGCIKGAEGTVSMIMYSAVDKSDTN